MRLLHVIIIIVVSSNSLSSQSLPYKIYDSDNVFNEYDGERILEINGKLLVFGIAEDTLNNPGESNMHISQFDSHGTSQSIQVWNNPAFDAESMSLTDIEKHLVGSQVIMPYYSADQSCIVSKEIEIMSDFELLSCEELQGSQKTRAIGASVIWPYDSLQIIQNTANKRGFLISGVGLDSQGAFVDHIIEPQLPYRYIIQDIYALNEDTLIATGLYLNNLPDSREDHERGVFIAKIDRDYRLADYALIGTEYSGSSVTVQGHLDKEGYVIIGCGVLDKQDYIDTGLTRGYSATLKIDPSTYEILWETPLDSTVFRNRRSHITKFENSHQNDGYIYVGRGYKRPTGGETSLIYGKISTEGETLWHHEFFDPYAPTSISAVDVLATSDGHYTLTGARVDRSDDSGFDTFVQLILMKFDEDGNVVDLPTSTEDVESNLVFSVVPNPASESITLETGSSMEKKILIVDQGGQLVKSLTCGTADCTLDTSELAVGQYTILLSDKKGGLLGRAPLVIKR